MELIYLILIALTGVIAGFVNVLAGGGSLLTMPIMKLLLGLNGPQVNGTNRIAIGAGAVSAVIGFFKKGYADFRSGGFDSGCSYFGGGGFTDSFSKVTSKDAVGFFGLGEKIDTTGE